MLRKIIPSRKLAVEPAEIEAEAAAEREALIRQLTEQARNGGKAEREEFRFELDVWNARRVVKLPSDASFDRGVSEF